MLYVRYLGKDYPAVDDPANFLSPEATDVEKHFGIDLMAMDGDPRQITGQMSTCAIVYVTLKRAHRAAFTWEVLNRMTQGEVLGLLVNLDEHGNEITSDQEDERPPADDVVDPPADPAGEAPSTSSGSLTGGDSSTSGTGPSPKSTP